MTASLAPAVDLGDVELMVRVQADDPDAFGALYDRFGARAYRVGYAISRDGTRAEDIVQAATCPSGVAARPTCPSAAGHRLGDGHGA